MKSEEEIHAIPNWEGTRLASLAYAIPFTRRSGLDSRCADAQLLHSEVNRNFLKSKGLFSSEVIDKFLGRSYLA